MQIQLEIINRTGLERGVVTRFTVEDAPAVIGRGRKADWELPDASRFLSSAHCRVSPSGGGFVIAVLSANGIVLNGASLAQGAEERLSDGDRIEIGPYLMRASHGTSNMQSGDRTVVLRAHGKSAPDERTVIQLGKAHAAPVAASDIVPRGTKPDVMAPPPALPFPGRAPAASSPAKGVEFVREFAAGAGIDPDALAGRTNLEFAGELGGAMRNAVLGLAALSRSSSDLRALVASRTADSGSLAEASAGGIDGGRLLASLFSVGGSDYRRAAQSVGDLSEALQAHDAAVFHAVQTALFRLLNELSPLAVESGTRAAILRSKNAKNWERYVKTWESLSTGRENGMLDVFLDYFREAYDERMSGH